MYRFLYPYPRLWIFVWKSQKFGKSLETFGTPICVLRFLRLIGWYGCFKSVSSMFCSKLLLILNLQTLFYQRRPLEAYSICIKRWCLVRQEIHRLGPMDLNISTLAKNLRLWLDSYRFLPKLSVTPISRYTEGKVEPGEETAASTKPGEEPRIFEILDKLEQVTDALISRWFNK